MEIEIDSDNPYKNIDHGELHRRLGYEDENEKIKESDLNKIDKGEIGDKITTTKGKEITINQHDKEMVRFAKNLGK